MDNTEYKFNCDKCNYHTNIMISYNKHLEGTLHKTGKRKTRSDRKKDIYKCDLCEYSSTNEHNYKTHFLNNHSTKEERKKQFTYYCDRCDFGNFIESCYETHINTKKHKMKTI